MSTKGKIILFVIFAILSSLSILSLDISFIMMLFGGFISMVTLIPNIIMLILNYKKDIKLLKYISSIILYINIFTVVVAGKATTMDSGDLYTYNFSIFLIPFLIPLIIIYFGKDNIIVLLSNFQEYIKNKINRFKNSNYYNNTRIKFIKIKKWISKNFWKYPKVNNYLFFITSISIFILFLGIIPISLYWLLLFIYFFTLIIMLFVMRDLNFILHIIIIGLWLFFTSGLFAS